MATYADRTKEAIMIEGAAGTGKSSYILQRTAALVEAGTPPSEILILAASPDAAHVLANKLEAKIGAPARQITITAPRFIALQILGEEAACTQAGRDARIFTPFEYNIAMQDLKISGLKPQRLREMVKFLFRGWSELRQNEPGWLINSQERGLVDMLKECADSNRCYFDVEVSAAAVNHLNCDDAALGRHMRPYVLVDDYTSLSRASQILAGTLASRLLCVTCDPTVRATLFEQYPYPEGAEEFLELNPNAQKVCLTKSALPADTLVGIKNATSDETYRAHLKLDAGNPDARGIQTLSFDEPIDELNAIVSLIKDEIAHGRLMSEIYIASPSKAWSSLLMHKLREAGIPSCTNNPGAPLSGDIRNLAHCQASQIFALLQMCANPDDPAAIRSWCGFGDSLARSGEFERLRTYCTEFGIPLSEALRNEFSPSDGRQSETEAFARLRFLYSQALDIVESARNLRGGALISALAHGIAKMTEAKAPDARAAASLSAICGPIDKADTAEVLLERAYARLALPEFPQENAVRIGGLANAYGLSSSLVICSAFVNGFIPCVDYFDRTVVTAEKQTLLYRKGLESFHTLLSSAPKSLTFTHFRSIELAETNKLRVKVDRIRLDKKKRRLCLVSPSIYLEKLEEEL